TGLENRRACKGTVGSNPTPSASNVFRISPVAQEEVTRAARHMIKSMDTRKIAPYVWVHPGRR
ncbi:MAG: hypothetical protein ACXWKP_29710, partial [Bradyrhizobium sp.]